MTKPSMSAPALRWLAVLALVLAAYGAGANVLGGITSQLTDVAKSITAPVSGVVSGDQQATVKQVIESSNQAQAKAFNTNDDSAMRQYATDSFYQQLVQTNRDLRSSGATEITLVSTEYRDVVVNGSTANATTIETWRTTYQDGSSDETTARNEYTLVLDGNAWKVNTDDQPSAVEQPAPRPNTDTTTPSAARSFSTSSNWSGYAATGGSYTSVTGTWTVPNVTATTSGADATWVGIGGVDSNDLIQAGTQATVSGGAVEYDAWIEMLPQSSRPVSLSVNPGDSVTVTISQQSGDQWSISIKNNTTGNRYATTVTYRSSNSSAEWVQEAPSVGRGTVALDQFGSLTFTGATAVRDGKTLDLSDLGAQAITMINGARQPLAQPSVIGPDGASFTVTRTDAQSTGGTGTGRRRRGG